MNQSPVAQGSVSRGPTRTPTSRALLADRERRESEEHGSAPLHTFHFPLDMDIHFKYSFLMGLRSSSEPGSRRPPFLWDYDLNETEIRAILAQKELSPLKRWLMERILTEGRFEQICEYLDLATIRQSFDQLRLPPHIKARWEYALKRWTAT